MFAGQIDLAEIPDFSMRRLLPAKGVLYFFVGSQSSNEPDVRVVFDPDAHTGLMFRSLPSDQLSVHDDGQRACAPATCRWVPHQEITAFRYRFEFPRYEIEPVLCRLYRDHHPTHHWGETGGRYQKLWRREQSKEVLRALGEPSGHWLAAAQDALRSPDGALDDRRVKRSGEDLTPLEALPFTPRVYGESWLPDASWPYAPVFMEIAASFLIKQAEGPFNRPVVETLRKQMELWEDARYFFAHHIERIEQVTDAAKTWLAIARGLEPDTAIPPDLHSDFRTWIASLGSKELYLDPEYAEKMRAYKDAVAKIKQSQSSAPGPALPMAKGEVEPFHISRIQEVVSTSLMQGIEMLLLEHPKARHLVPEAIIEFFTWRHAPLFDNGRRWIRHQMLGPPRIMQDFQIELAESNVLLMQLDSDDPMHWMWGDVGVLQYWISREDLKALNFDAVESAMAGG